MNRNQARYEALMRAHGVLQTFIDGGTIWEQYPDLEDTDVGKIEKEFQHIMENIWNQSIRAPKGPKPVETGRRYTHEIA